MTSPKIVRNCVYAGETALALYAEGWRQTSRKYGHASREVVDNFNPKYRRTMRCVPDVILAGLRRIPIIGVSEFEREQLVAHREAEGLCTVCGTMLAPIQLEEGLCLPCEMNDEDQAAIDGLRGG